jgi:hypothetical protein
MEKWIQGAIKNPGALTRKAKAAGMGVQEFARAHAGDSGKTGKQARLALTLNKLRKAANGAVKGPIEDDVNSPSMILVGDGGSDPAAEEYVFLPPGSAAVIAPKSSPSEKPTMENAIRAVEKTQLKRAATGLSTQAKASLAPSAGLGEVISAVDPSEARFARGARNILRGAKNGAVIDDRLHRAATGYTRSPILSPGGMVVGYQSVPASPTTQPRDYQAEMLKLERDKLAATKGNQQAMLQAQAAQQANALALERERLAAQQGYWNASTANQRYATDAQKWIAEQNLAAQRAQQEAILAYNRERLALDKLLGERAAAVDEANARTQAMQMLMTRAGRQLVAPGGNVIPSMQPMLGRSIN